MTSSYENQQNLHDFHTLMGEINILNELCDLGKMLRLVRNLNGKLVNCKSDLEKLQIFVDISNGSY